MKLQRNRLEKTLEELSNSSVEYVKDEFRSILESNINFQQKTDYIGNAIISIDEKIKLLDEEVKAIKDYKSKLKTAKDLALETGASIFQEYGISKIEGASISSISLTQALETSKLEVIDVINSEELINQGFAKQTIDEKKILKSYMDGEYRDFIDKYAKLEVVTKITPAKLRINKRRSSSNNTDYNINIPDIDVA